MSANEQLKRGTLASGAASRQRDDEGAADETQLSRYYLGEEGLTDTMTEFLRRWLSTSTTTTKVARTSTIDTKNDDNNNNNDYNNN